MILNFNYSSYVQFTCRHQTTVFYNVLQLLMSLLLWWHMTVKYWICIITGSWHVNDLPHSVWRQCGVYVFISVVIKGESEHVITHLSTGVQSVRCLIDRYGAQWWSITVSLTLLPPDVTMMMMMMDVSSSSLLWSHFIADQRTRSQSNHRRRLLPVTSSGWAASRSSPPIRIKNSPINIPEFREQEKTFRAWLII